MSLHDTESTISTNLRLFSYIAHMQQHRRDVTCAATRRPNRPPAARLACADAGPNPAPSPAAPGLQQPPQPLAPAAASTAAEAVEEVVDRRALLAAAAADGRPAGVEVDGGNHWPALDDAGLAGRVADGRDAPVKGG